MGGGEGEGVGVFVKQTWKGGQKLEVLNKCTFSMPS